MIKRIAVVLLALVLMLCLANCGKKQRQMRVYLHQKAEVANKSDGGEGLEITGLVYLDLGGELETVVTGTNGAIITTGVVTYASDVDSVCFEWNNDRRAFYRVRDYKARRAKITATYTDEDIDPVVKEMDFVIMRQGEMLDTGWGFDFDNHEQVSVPDNLEADIVITDHTWGTYNVKMHFPGGYKVITVDPNIIDIQFPFSQYEQYPDDSELTATDFITEGIDLDQAAKFFIFKSTAGKYFKVWFWSSGNAAIELRFSYLELLPPQE